MYCLDCIYTSKVIRTFPIILGWVFLFISLSVNAQYTLPKFAVLVKNGVNVIHVSKTPMRLKKGLQEDISEKSFSRIPQKISTYFINPSGWIDSIYFYPNDTNQYYKKEVLTYTEGGDLLAYKTLSQTGEMEMLITVKKVHEDEWFYSLWEHGELKKEINSTKDSIIYKSITHRTHNPKHFFSTYSYDLSQEIKTETWFEGEKLLSKEIQQWIAVNGIPERFIQKTYNQAEKNEKPKTEILEFKVDEKGMVINSLNGLVFDPFRLDNYFSRHQRFQGIVSPHESLFIEDTLITESEISELVSFDGVDIVYLYNFRYDKL
jgi:hypothetical protein